MGSGLLPWWLDKFDFFVVASILDLIIANIDGIDSAFLKSFQIIIFCIFSILGVYFYDGIDYIKYKDKFYVINEYYNLDNFYNVFLFTFLILWEKNGQI